MRRGASKANPSPGRPKALCAMHQAPRRQPISRRPRFRGPQNRWGPSLNPGGVGSGRWMTVPPLDRTPIVGAPQRSCNPRSKNSGSSASDRGRREGLRDRRGGGCFPGLRRGGPFFLAAKSRRGGTPRSGTRRSLLGRTPSPARRDWGGASSAAAHRCLWSRCLTSKARTQPRKARRAAMLAVSRQPPRTAGSSRVREDSPHLRPLLTT